MLSTPMLAPAKPTLIHTSLIGVEVTVTNCLGEFSTTLMQVLIKDHVENLQPVEVRRSLANVVTVGMLGRREEHKIGRPIPLRHRIEVIVFSASPEFDKSMRMQLDFIETEVRVAKYYKCDIRLMLEHAVTLVGAFPVGAYHGMPLFDSTLTNAYTKNYRLSVDYIDDEYGVLAKHEGTTTTYA